MEKEEWDEGISHFKRTVYHTCKGDLTSLHRTEQGIYTTWTLQHLLENITDIEKYLSLQYEPPEIDMALFYREQEQLGDKGLMMLDFSDPICLAAELFEISTFLVHATTEPDKTKYFLDAFIMPNKCAFIF